MGASEHDQSERNTHIGAKQLDAVGWGLFLIWIGVAFLVDLSWGAGFLGIGVIVLGVQAARQYFSLPIERFSLVLGTAFFLGGIRELFDIRLRDISIPGGLMPILFIVVGTALIVSALRRQRHEVTEDHEKGRKD